MKANMRSLSILLLTAVSFIATLPTTTLAEQCSFCTDGSPPEGQFGGIDCADFEADLASTDADSEVCRQFQLAAYQHCSCPSFPEADFCPLCANGFYDIPNPSRPIVGWMKNERDGSWLTCNDVLFGDTTATGECERNSLAAFYCGCPDAVAPVSSCSLCPDDDSAAPAVDLLVEDPDASNRRVPPMFDVTCGDYSQSAELFEEGEACEELGADLPIQLTEYCGCKVERAPSAVACTLCPADADLLSDQTTFLPANNKTVVSCAEWHVVAASVTDESYCSETIAAMKPFCCDGVAVSDGEGTTTTDAPPEGGEESRDKDASMPNSVVCSLLAGVVGVGMMMWM